jgi:hypothetical protein
MIDSSFISPDGESQSGHESPESRAVATFLPHREWSEEELQEQALRYFSINPWDVRYFKIEDDCTFQIGHVTLTDQAGFYLYTESKAYLHVHGDCVINNGAKTGGILANYKRGRMPAVDAYVSSLGNDYQDYHHKTEGSDSLPANSPSDVHTEVNSQGGESDV